MCGLRADLQNLLAARFTVIDRDQAQGGLWRRSASAAALSQIKASPPVEAYRFDT
jgi:hypothetical protein